ncbi:hypothetical protein [Telmatospirillum siberiense]|uniref:hypothetical protein n=1 Tax=Telmatospirillum siberiense TaxID=382514 RepID=UPI0018EDE49E|nr:hypothetical protein [Telmatospirillum siberiense]
MTATVVFTPEAEEQLVALYRAIAASSPAIAYGVMADKISIIGVFHGGQDYEAALQTEE